MLHRIFGEVEGRESGERTNSSFPHVTGVHGKQGASVERFCCWRARRFLTRSLFFSLGSSACICFSFSARSSFVYAREEISLPARSFFLAPPHLPAPPSSQRHSISSIPIPSSSFYIAQRQFEDGSSV